MARIPIIAGNWKMNLLTKEGKALVRGITATVTDARNAVEVVVCPTFVALTAVADAVENTPVQLGAQNTYCKPEGAYTGEVAPQMLRDVGCQWVIVGHSERRQLFGETDGLLNDKLKFALSEGLRVMFCIGETLEERESGQMETVLETQLIKGLEGLEESDFTRLVLAYEPVWAIGTGVTATPEQAEQAHAFVRGVVAQEYTIDIADALRIQYGGSVKPDNAATLMACPNVDGALVGGAALDADSFSAIINGAVESARSK